MREEHRTITVLFADLAGSTALAERLHDEEVKLVVGEAVGRVVFEIERLGGYVKDLAGDGVLAFFGAPVSHEDDAERAARAALGILASIGAYSTEVARGWGVDRLAVRIGISTGPVALGPIVAGHRVEYAAFGDTVNTAARLQSAAAVDTVFVDSATHRIIEPLFDWTAPHELQLKGKSAPTHAFGLLGTVAAPSRHRWAGGRLAPIIGRANETSRMQQAVDSVRAGRGGIVSITGQAGVGKSRLLADTQDRSEGDGEGVTAILWLEGRCASYAEGIPYFPVRDLLHDWLGVSDGDPEVRVRIALRRALDQLFGESAVDVYPYLAALLGLASDEKPGSGFELGAEELQQRTFAAIATLIDRLAQDTPIVVAFEDLHWADATSIKLVLALLPVVERAAVLLVMTHRDDRDHAAWGLKEAAARDFPHLNSDVALESLPTAAERLLLHELVGVGTLSADLEHRVLDAADGNPLFLEELVRSLVDTGALVQGEESHWRLDRDVAIVIPETVERVILARADRLPPTHREVLTAASVAGRRFDLSLLADLAGPHIALQDALHNLQRLGFVVQERRWPEPEYRFKHVLIQEAIYRTMLSDERTRLHQAAAESLERRTRATQDDVLALARHWRAAGHHARATPYYRRGAELAIRAFANDEAAEALTHALNLLHEEPESQSRDQLELELRIALGVPLVARGGWGTTEVRDNYARARDLCIRLDQPVSPPILRGLAINSVIRLELDQAMEYGLALLEVAQRTDDQLLNVEANYALGVTSFWEGDFTASASFLEEAIARYSSDHHERHIALYSQDPKVVCLCRLGLTRSYLGYPRLAASARDEAITLAEELEHPFSLGHAYAFGAVISHELQEGRRRDELLAALESLATKMGLNFWVMFSSVYKHWAAAQLDPGEIAPMKAAMTKLSETGQTLWSTFFLALIARAQFLAGDPSSGLESIEEALRQTHVTGARYIESELHRLRGELLRARGASARDVEAAFRLAHAVAVRQRAKTLELRAAVALTSWLVASGSVSDKVDGLRILEEAYGWFAEDDDTPDLAAARKLLVDLS